MDDKFNPKDKFYCTKLNKYLTYLECQANFIAGNNIECYDPKNHLACITGDENNEIISLFYEKQKKKRGRPKKVKIDKKLQPVVKPDPPPKKDKPKRLELKRKIYFTPRPDLLEKVETLAKANIRTFSEQVLWMIQEHLYTHPDPDEMLYEKAKLQAMFNDFIKSNREKIKEESLDHPAA